jgi:hypothetical protein
MTGPGPNKRQLPQPNARPVSSVAAYGPASPRLPFYRFACSASTNPVLSENSSAPARQPRDAGQPDVSSQMVGANGRRVSAERRPSAVTAHRELDVTAARVLSWACAALRYDFNRPPRYSSQWMVPSGSSPLPVCPLSSFVAAGTRFPIPWCGRRSLKNVL